MAIISGDTLIPQEPLKGIWYWISLVIIMIVILMIIAFLYPQLNIDLNQPSCTNNCDFNEPINWPVLAFILIGTAILLFFVDIFMLSKEIEE